AGGSAAYMLERRGARVYWYGYRHHNGKVRRVYGGSGPAALQAAKPQQQRRQQQQAERQQVQQAEQKGAATTQALDHFSGLLDLFTRATLTHLGYHQHARGDWRLRRHVRD